MSYLCELCEHPIHDGCGDLDEAFCEDCGCHGLHISCAKSEGWVYDAEEGFWRCEGCHEEHASKKKAGEVNDGPGSEVA